MTAHSAKASDTTSAYKKYAGLRFPVITPSNVSVNMSASVVKQYVNAC